MIRVDFSYIMGPTWPSIVQWRGDIWGLVCQKQVSRAGTSNYTDSFFEVELLVPALDICFGDTSPHLHVDTLNSYKIPHRISFLFIAKQSLNQFIDDLKCMILRSQQPANISSSSQMYYPCHTCGSGDNCKAFFFVCLFVFLFVCLFFVLCGKDPTTDYTNSRKVTLNEKSRHIFRTDDYSAFHFLIQCMTNSSSWE